jgi:hypothetical protein
MAFNSSLKRLRFQITDNATKDIIKDQTMVVRATKLGSIRGPFLNNHVMYQIKKTGSAKIVHDKVTFEYTLTDATQGVESGD